MGAGFDTKISCVPWMSDHQARIRHHRRLRRQRRGDALHVPWTLCGYDVMVREMPRYLRCQHLSTPSKPARDAALGTLAGSPPPGPIPTNGAQVAARMIAGLISAT